MENLVDTFLSAGKISLDLRNKGLIKEIKSDNTPVSNGDLEVNKFLLNKLCFTKGIDTILNGFENSQKEIKFFVM